MSVHTLSLALRFGWQRRLDIYTATRLARSRISLNRVSKSGLVKTQASLPNRLLRLCIMVSANIDNRGEEGLETRTYAVTESVT